MINIIGKIINSTFIQHLHGVIYMDTSTTNHLFQSQQLREYPIDYVISYNEFNNNYGSYIIYLSLIETSKLQRIQLIYNKFLNNR